MSMREVRRTERFVIFDPDTETIQDYEARLMKFQEEREKSGNPLEEDSDPEPEENHDFDDEEKSVHSDADPPQPPYNPKGGRIGIMRRPL